MMKSFGEFGNIQLPISDYGIEIVENMDISGDKRR
jgi:hypothetical protein